MARLAVAEPGIMLVRTVRLVHLAATLVDLTARGYLRIEVTDGAEPDWLITRVRPVPLLTRDEDLLRRRSRRAFLTAGRPARGFLPNVHTYV